MKVLNLKRVLFVVALFCTTTVIATEKGFAIFIDKVSYKEAKAEVDAYAQ